MKILIIILSYLVLGSAHADTDLEVIQVNIQLQAVEMGKPHFSSANLVPGLLQEDEVRAYQSVKELSSRRSNPAQSNQYLEKAFGVIPDLRVTLFNVGPGSNDKAICIYPTGAINGMKVRSNMNKFNVLGYTVDGFKEGGVMCLSINKILSFQEPAYIVLEAVTDDTVVGEQELRKRYAVYLSAR